MTQLQLLYGHLIANLFAVLILVLCWRSKTFGRFGLMLLFLWASQYNFRTAFARPAVLTALRGKLVYLGGRGVPSRIWSQSPLWAALQHFPLR